MKSGLLTKYPHTQSGSSHASDAESTATDRPVTDTHSPFFHGRNPVQHAPLLQRDPPEDRAERIEQLRKQVRGGAYQIPLAHLVRILASLMLRRR